MTDTDDPLLPPIIANDEFGPVRRVPELVEGECTGCISYHEDCCSLPRCIDNTPGSYRRRFIYIAATDEALVEYVARRMNEGQP
jgi:hypothetical protein